jgi:hypothetical protein
MDSVADLWLPHLKEWSMSANSKKSMGWAIVLIILGMAALYGGSKWLSLLIPVALLVWFTAKPTLRSGRN